MELNLRGKAALVTGGSSGIGRVICKGLASEGVRVAIMARNEDRGNKVRKECESLGVDSFFLKVDVADEEAVMSAVREVLLKRFGRIDILVHSADPYVSSGFQTGSFLGQSFSIERQFVDVLLCGAIHCTRAVLDSMIKHKSGRIIYIGSDAGRVGDGHQAVYAAAKAGVVGFMKSIAQGVGSRNILVNVVSPGLTLTEEDLPLFVKNYGWGTEEGEARLTKAYPTRRLARAEDIADMVVFLSSDRAGDVTGQVIGVDGGFCMPSP